jgi:hypothetical protein
LRSVADNILASVGPMFKTLPPVSAWMNMTLWPYLTSDTSQRIAFSTASYIRSAVEAPHRRNIRLEGTRRMVGHLYDLATLERDQVRLSG